jgi:DNA-binding MarR family transcriptional regulator
MKKSKHPTSEMLLKLLALLDGELNRLSTVKMVHIFVQICIFNDESGGVSQAKLMRLLGEFSSTMSRNLQMLGVRHRDGKGLGLIELRADPQDSRAKIIFVTSRGRRLWEQMQAVLDQS